MMKRESDQAKIKARAAESKSRQTAHATGEARFKMHRDQRETTMRYDTVNGSK